jgi:hypothetical protein
MTVTVDPALVEPDLETDEPERVETTETRPDVQALAALLAQAYVAMPLFA